MAWTAAAVGQVTGSARARRFFVAIRCGNSGLRGVGYGDGVLAAALGATIYFSGVTPRFCSRWHGCSRCLRRFWFCASSLVGGIFVLVGILAAELLGALTAPESPEPIFEGRIYFESTWRL